MRREVAEPRGRRLVIAIAFMLLVFVLGAAPRVFLYGAPVAPSTALRVLLFLVELGILVLLARPNGRPFPKRALGAALLLVVCSGATLLEAELEALSPGSIYPPVLYREPPSMRLAFVSTITEALLRVALWTLVYVFPLKLDEAHHKAAEAIELGRAWVLAKRRALLKPLAVKRTLADISALIERDPRGARERLALFAEELDGSADPELEPASPLPAPTAFALFTRNLAVPTPSLRTPMARQRFVLGTLAITLLLALSSLTRFAEHGWASLRLDVPALARISLELLVFWRIAEPASRRGLAVTRTISITLLASLLIGFLVTLVQLGLEARFPGLLFPPSIYTHPTPASRQLVRAFVTALIDVGFWTLVYLHPLASLEADERAALATRLRREAELARLKATLAPHFVRNALNLIAGLVTEDPDEARRLLRGLGELLLELGRDEDDHPLSREIAWLEAYTALLEARHPDLLSFRFESDPGAKDVIIPRLLLQPLVENAVLHGALAREGGGEVRVRVEKLEAPGLGSSLRCIIEDNGPGMQRETRAKGLGVRLVRERLSTRAAGGRLTYQSSAQGTRAVLDMPLEEKP